MGLSRGHEIAADESAVGLKSLKADTPETLGTGIIGGGLVCCFFFVFFQEFVKKKKNTTIE